MSWVKLDDRFAEHPKIARVGAIGAWLQVQALCYSNGNVTDGFLPFDVARSFLLRGVTWHDADGRPWAIALTYGASGRDIDEIDWLAVMVEAGIWEPVQGGYKIHDYEYYQPTKAGLTKDREQGKERARRFREARRNAGSNAVTHAVSNATNNALPVPVPVPVPKKQGLTRSLRSLAVSDPPGFVLWWNVYPRKVARAAAVKAWNQVFGTTDPPISRMVDAIAWQRQSSAWLEGNGKFIPHPASYLHGRRWEDEPTPTAGAFADPRTSGNAQVLAEALAELSERTHA